MGTSAPRTIRAFAEVVLPKIDDQEFFFFAFRQAVVIAAGLLVARAAADHLPQLDAGLHGLHENQVDHLGHVHARIQHVHRNRDARLVLALEAGDQAIAPGTVVHALHAVVDKLEHANLVGKHLLEHVADALGMLLGHGEHDGLADMWPPRSRMPLA
jgi:hypothetical protein